MEDKQDEIEKKANKGQSHLISQRHSNPFHTCFRIDSSVITAFLDVSQHFQVAFPNVA